MQRQGYFTRFYLVAKLATRGVLRNKRRSSLTVLLISCGLATLLFADAYMEGAYEAMIRIATDTFMGQAQIHRKNWRDTQDIDLYIQETGPLLTSLDRRPTLEAYSPRTLAHGMLSSSSNLVSGLVYGVDPDLEKHLSKLERAVLEGDYLSHQPGEILIGTEMAAQLEVGLGERLVMTVSQAHGGELSQSLFRVSGIFEFGDRHMDTSLAFVNLTQAQSLLKVQGLHEIALRFDHIQQADNAELKIWDDLNTQDLQIANWRALIPQLSGILELSDLNAWIIAAIIFVLVSLGLINSMFMSIYERQYEFGVLIAIGTRPSVVFAQILYEGFIIGVTSACLGLGLGLGISDHYARVGIDFGGAEFSGVTLTDPIFPIIHWTSFCQYALLITLITVVACIYPAIHAAKLKPSHAMRKVL